MTPRPMKPSEEAAVQALYLRAYPGWASLPPQWFFAHPTLVICEGKTIIGSTSCSIGPAPILGRENNEDEILWGRGVSVAPAYRGKGLGRILAKARLQFGHDLGLRFFVGMTWEGNAVMRGIFEKLDCELRPERIANAYPGNPPDQQIGLIFTRGI